MRLLDQSEAPLLQGGSNIELMPLWTPGCAAPVKSVAGVCVCARACAAVRRGRGSMGKFGGRLRKGRSGGRGRS